MKNRIFTVLVLNQIAAAGLKRLPAAHYNISKDAADPDAILVRSADMNALPISPNVKAIGRAGAGTNNIPVEAMSGRGVPVFNAPGANANAVKEMVFAGMLMAARHAPEALHFANTLPAGADFDKRIEDGKKHFAGVELQGRTLGVIGLGAVGGLVADLAVKLGMRVLGFDPNITVESAWQLSSSVKKAHSVDEVIKASDFISIHVPLLDATRHLINAERLQHTKRGAVLLNFSRQAIVDEAAAIEALKSKHLHAYVCDFPSPALQGLPSVIAFPHLGASTHEAEEQSAVMVADQVRDYLEHGNIRNSVNFPQVEMARESPHRLAIANANVPNMVGQISTAMAQAGLNIHNMVNRSRGEMAYTLVDLDSEPGEAVVARIAAIHGVLAVRKIPKPEIL